MTEQAKIEVIDKSGWCKEYPLEKTITHIGSNPRNDIVLEPGRGGGVASVHAQVITSPHNLTYQLVNLGDASILFDTQILRARSAAYLADGSAFRLGEFTLVFHAGEFGYAGVVGGIGTRSQCIGLSLSLPRAQLRPNKSIEGSVTVSNLGDETGVQFNLETEGLEPDCYNIEPGPLLSSGAEKEVFFQLHHRGDKPLVGDYTITIRATAPSVYPNEEASVSRVIQVLPFYHHKLELVSPDEPKPMVSIPKIAERFPTRAKASPPPETEDWWAPTAPPPAIETAPTTQVEATEPAPQPEVQPPQATWWQKLVGALPSHRRKAEAPPQEKPPVSPEPDLAPRPTPPAPPAAALDAQIVAPPPPEVSAELEAPTALPILAEEEPRPEPERVAPEPVAEEPPAPTPVDLPEQAPEPEALTPASEVEAQFAAPAEPTPPEAEPVKARELAPEAEPPKREPVKPPPKEVSPLPEMEPEPPAEEAEPEPPAEELVRERVREDWWTPQAKVSPEPEIEEPQVLKLKASRAPKAAAEAPQPTPPPPAQDWWTTEPEASLESEIEKSRVLKLKASPTPETEAEPEPTGPPQPTEDWWTSQPEEDE